MKNKIRYHVEWCAEVPEQSNGEADIYNARYESTDFQDLQSAIDFALKNLQKDCFGCTRIEEQEYIVDDGLFDETRIVKMIWKQVRYMHVDETSKKYSQNDLEFQDEDCEYA